MNLIGATQSVLAYAKPVFDGYFADPFLFRSGDRFYAIGTGPLSPDGEVFHLLTSLDLRSWTSTGYAMGPLTGREKSSYWAPEVSESDGRFYLYYSVGEGDTGHRIRVAIADSAEGPYQDFGPLTSESISFAIDPHVYRHVDGSTYLYYATDFLDGDSPGTGLVVDRMVSPTLLEGGPTVVARAGSDWQRFQSGRAIYGEIYDWHTLEGPAATWHDGQLFVFYSGGNWQNDSYGVDYVIAPHPCGPYSPASSPSPRILRSGVAGLIGPGHNSIVNEGGQSFTAFHAWNADRTARLMHVGELGWTSDGPKLSSS